jgi:hypothetical protein
LCQSTRPIGCQDERGRRRSDYCHGIHHPNVITGLGASERTVCGKNNVFALRILPVRAAMEFHKYFELGVVATLITII